MKRFSKVFSGIAAIMLGFGIMLIAIGFGSAKSDWEKISGAQQGADTIERTFEAKKDVEIELSLGVMRVEASWDEQIHFQAAGVRAEAVKISEDAGKIQIRMSGESGAAARLISIPVLLDGNFSYGAFSYDEYRENAGYPVYVLFVPENYAGILDISLDVGVVSVQEITAGELKAAVDVGGLQIDGCTAKRLSAECDMGVNIVSGAYEDITVENDIGTVDVRIIGSKEDYNGELACELGQMRYMRASVPANAGTLVEQLEQAAYFYFDVTEKGGVDRSYEWYGASAKGQLKVQCDIGEIEVRPIEPKE